MVDQAQQLRNLVKKSNKVPFKREQFKVNLSRVIAVASGKGGVGKTNFVANVGITMSRLGKRVIIVDADLGLANVDLVFGISSKYHLGHVISGEKKLSEIVIDAPEGVKIVAGGAGIAELANMSDADRVRFIGSLGELEDMADIILIDTSAGISNNVLGFVLAADEVVIITTTEPTAIRDAYGVIKVLAREGREVDMKLVVNMVDDEEEAEDVANRIKMVVSQFLGSNIEYIGYILRDSSVQRAVLQSEPFAIAFPKAKATRCVADIAGKLVHLESEGRARGKGIKSFLFRLLRLNTRGK